MKLFDASFLGKNSRHVGWFGQRQYRLEIIIVDLLLNGGRVSFEVKFKRHMLGKSTEITN